MLFLIFVLEVLPDQACPNSVRNAICPGLKVLTKEVVHFDQLLAKS